MINENELQISNKSYINKDFASIYPELLDLVKKLTDKWDPETSNESDPGVVLLKLMAFIGDKLNYNIDKNVLECFMPSATQESSMRKLVEMMGCEMAYYVASTVQVQFYTDSDEGTINLPAFKTVLSSNEDDGVSFVLVEDVQVNKDDAYAPVKTALQGELMSLYILSSENTTITLDNIDDNNRLYFPIENVAQNGVFIESVDSGARWERVHNLNIVTPGKKVYKFGYDSSRRLPYVEFPEDIISIIGSGITVNYIKTDGENGNVKSRYIKRVIGNESVTVTNVSSSFGGANPQSIDDAYNSFKKTVGTFDTLVSCRDYANFIYNMTDEYDIPWVSNVQVSDRRNDINYGTKVMTFSQNGIHAINVPSDEIAANDLCLYPLKPYNTTSLAGYYSSFLPYNDHGVPIDIIERAEFDGATMEDIKTVSHDYKELDTNDLYAIKNYATLDARIATTKKVDEYERAEIIKNVITNLMNKFNARNVDYGQEIPYESILKAIEEADKGINSVSLMEPELNTVFMSRSAIDGVSEFSMNTAQGRQYYILTLAHNIVEGKVSLFEYDQRFFYEFGESDGEVYENIKKLTTLLDKTITSTEYELKQNEAIQIIEPNILTKTHYAYGVKYKYTGNQVADGKVYKLGANDRLDLKYTNPDGETKDVVFEEGKIIQPNGFDLEQSGDYTMLLSSEGIDEKQVNAVELKSQTWCYWIRNTQGNTLFEDDDTEIILGDGEYFFYANDARTEFVSVGSGTIIRRTGLTSQSLWTLGAPVSYSDIAKDGLSAFVSKMRRMPFDNVSNYVTVVETSITTLLDGDKISSTVNIDLAPNDRNELIDLQDNASEISYTFKGETEVHSVSDVNVGISSYILGRLDLNVGPNLGQTLDEDQSITITLSDDSTEDLASDVTFKLNAVSQASGPEINLASWKADVDGNMSEIYEVSLYAHEEDATSLQPRGDKGFAELDIDGSEGKTFSIPGLDEDAVVMLYWAPADESDDMAISASDTLTKFESGEAIMSLDAGMTIVAIPAGTTSITFGANDGVSGKLTIGKLRYYSGINSRFGLTQAEETDLLNDIKSISKGQFCYTMDINNESAIETKKLDSPYAFYDVNNVASRFTITQLVLSLDEGGSSIEIMRSSRL